MDNKDAIQECVAFFVHRVAGSSRTHEAIIQVIKMAQAFEIEHDNKDVSELEIG